MVVVVLGCVVIVVITVAPSKAVWQLLTGGGEKQLTIQRKFVQIATVRE